jgi:hypothetical protein
MTNKKTACPKQMAFIDSKFMPFNFVILAFAILSFVSNSNG